MKISAAMDIDQLVGLMGKDVDGGSKATVNEAIELRDLLVRDHDGQDTDDIDGGRWMALCCAVDPAEQSN